MFEFLKLIFSKDFVSNAKEVLDHLRKSSKWRDDFVTYTGKFYAHEKDESTVLIEQSLKKLIEKGWSKDEVSEARFILNEIIDNSFKHGVPNKDLSFVSCSITITSTFIKLKSTDFGVDFNLDEELNNQLVYSANDSLHKGLSIICKYTPELYQEEHSEKNVIVVIKREGAIPMTISQDREITVLSMGKGTYLNQYNFKSFMDRLKSLKSKTKIIVDFAPSSSKLKDNMDSIDFIPFQSEAWRAVKSNLSNLKDQSGHRIAICGLKNTSVVMKEYFESICPVFEIYEDAYNFLSTGESDPIVPIY